MATARSATSSEATTRAKEGREGAWGVQNGERDKGHVSGRGMVQAGAFDTWIRGEKHGDRVSPLGPTVKQLACVSMSILGCCFKYHEP
jgi:hypothetical protein